MVLHMPQTMTFQHTAARRRLDSWLREQTTDVTVSTHSRPKAAGFIIHICSFVIAVSTHSRPKAAGKVEMIENKNNIVSTHSRPKAAGRFA